MPKTILHELSEFGQSVWLDYIDRTLLDSGRLTKLIEQGLRGMTSNPSIFDKAISKSSDYDEKIIQLKEAGKTTFEIYDELTVKDIQDAADQFEGVFNETAKLDGYVSLEINPQLAGDTEASIKEGIRLFKKVNRPNVMIKVPATEEGFPVVEELLAEGINVNVTLIFSFDQYLKTFFAYVNGLKKALKNGRELRNIRSVASVFVSRIDTTADKMILEKAKTSDQDAQEAKLLVLQGKAAVANSRLIYEKAIELFSSEDFKPLFEKGANIQRVLWGSTSTKNPDYSDTKYVTELIAKSTVNTIPANTLEAFMDHGEVRDAFQNVDAGVSLDIIRTLKGFGVDTDDICQKLLEDGVKAFVDSFESLLKDLEKKAQQLCAH